MPDMAGQSKMTLLLAVYVLAASGLFLYGSNCYLMVGLLICRYRTERARTRALIEAGQVLFDTPATVPTVTTQIALYNEANVAERIIRAAVAMDYPAAMHEIQVLDDSSDETRAILDQLIPQLQAAGHAIQLIRRPDRSGYKAGALRHGLTRCRGEYIAIFDADFVPPRDFLRTLVPLLQQQARIAFVQARWGHLNASNSLLTRAQTIGIDGHFMIEQCVRSDHQLFLNFNGTAGLWRKQAIIDGGNWQDDTLTEDMDLSYRCQLAGWTAHYCPDLVVPAELPERYTAFKSQQFRWAKGSIQTALKLMPRVMRSDASRFVKLQAFLHMTHYCIHPLMTLMAVLALPVLLQANRSLTTGQWIPVAVAILIAMTGPSVLYCASQFAQGRAQSRTLLYLPGLVCIGVGIALSNTRAVGEALCGIDSPFIRTPKSGARNKHYRSQASWLPLLELLMAAYCAFSFVHYLKAQCYWVGPFLLIYACGFLLVGYRSLMEPFERRPAPSPAVAAATGL